MSFIKLVTLDATNTFLKFRVPPWDHYATVASKYGFKGSGDDVKSKILQNYKYMDRQYPNFGKNTITWKQWWAKIIKMTFQSDCANSDINKIATELIEDFKTEKCWKIASGAKDLFKYLKCSGISVGVISNFDPRLNDILCNLKVNGHFDFVLTSYEVGICKPDKKIFKLAEKKCKREVHSSQCLHIGDDIKKDYEGARAAGWHACLLENETKIHPQSLKYTCSSFHDILNKIEYSDLYFEANLQN